MPAENLFRWAMILASLLAVIGLLAFARGLDHHHGQQVGAAGTVPVVTATVPA
jgi:MprA protease rhombosortase-interaction domain-containing protein